MPIDDLEDVIREARRRFWLSPMKGAHTTFEDAENAAIAAAIRERWPWIDWPCVTPYRIYEKHCLHDQGTHCCNCGATKPGPTPANGFTAVVKGKKVEVGDVVKLNDDGTVSKVTPEDERTK